jgi:alpha-tubulin suppressor-like RCC1 family protein
MSPGTESGLVGVRRIKATSKAFAAIKSDGSVIAWGDAAFGGNSKALDLRGTVALYSNDVAFVARKWDGTLRAWGPEGAGGKVPDYVSRFCPTGVTTVHHTKFAFFAECAPRPACSCREAGTGDDQFNAFWGRNDNKDPAVECPKYKTHQTCLQHETGKAFSGVGYCEYSCPGLDLPEELEPDVYRGSVFRGSFVAEHTYYEDAFQAAGFGDKADDEKEELLRTLRLGVAWGDRLYGGTSWGGSALTHPADIVQVASTGAAFGAVLANGRVATWGSATDGGVSPWAGKSDAELDNDPAFSKGNCDLVGQCARLCATDLYATEVAFAAKLDLCKTEATSRRQLSAQERAPLIAWPTDKAGYSTLDDATLESISGAGGVKSVVANKGAFAVLTEDGNVYAWGYPFYGGATPQPKITTATALQATDYAFAAVLADKTVQAWGDAKNGGELTDQLTSDLQSVSKLYANHVAFAAIKDDGSVVTWGDQANGGDSSSVAASLVNVKYIEASGSAFTAVMDSRSGWTVQ